MNNKKLALLLSLLQIGQPFLAYAQTSTTSSSYSVQVPVTTVPFTPSKTTYDFGNIIVGQRPQHLFTFINRGSDALTVNSVSGFSSASVVTDGCSGKTLKGGESCTIVGSLSVLQPGAISGELRVAHSSNNNPDVFALKATGVSVASAISATQPIVDFGDASLNQSIGPKPVSFKNTGSVPVEILDLTLADGGSNYILDISGCVTTLAPGTSCSAQATFKPQALGLLQGRIVGMLGDGSEVTLANLSGNGVQGTPTWSATQLNFLDGAVNAKSASQTVTLMNTGRGPLSITSAAITGDSTFKLESSTCGVTLVPGSSCTFQVSNTPTDTSIHSGYLELQTTNSSLKTARIQVYSRPMTQKAVLAVDPISLDFGDMAVGASKTLTVTLKSVGNITANVSKYVLGGPNVAAFSILNATQCTGALAPNNQCVLQIQAKPTAVGAQVGSVTLTTDTPDLVPPIQLKANGLGPSVSADKVLLSFGTVSQGNTPTLSAVISNTGGAPAKLNSISAPQGTAIFTNTRDTTGACVVGGTLAAGATCKLNVTFLTAGLTGAQTGSFVMNFDSGAVAVSTSGTVSVAPPPSASLSLFKCPTPVVGTPFTCVGAFTNTGTSNIALTATNPVELSNSLFSAGVALASTTCPTEAAGGLAPGASCSITINGKATSLATWQTGVTAKFKRVGVFTASTLPQNSGSATSSASTGAQAAVAAAQLTDFTCDVGTSALLNSAYSCAATLSATGNTPLAIIPSSFTTALGNKNPANVTSNCPASLAVGATCKVTVTGAVVTAGLDTVTVTAQTNAPSVSKSFSLTGNYAAVKLTTTSHPVVQYGEKTTAVHTVTNQGAWPTKFLIDPIAKGNGLAVTGTTCGSSIAAGATCTITTTCTPSATTSTGTLTVYPSAPSTLPTTGSLTCSGISPSLRLESATGQTTTNAGAYSLSGNWYRLVNTGPGTVTPTAINAVKLPNTVGNYVIYTDATKTGICAPNKPIPVNGSCQFLLTGALPPNVNERISLQITSNAPPVFSNETVGITSSVSLVETKRFQDYVYTGATDTAEVMVINQANWPLSSVLPVVAGQGFSLVSHDCPSTLAVGASCKVSLKFVAPPTLSYSPIYGLNIYGAYPQILNGVAYPPVTSGPRGGLTRAVALITPKITSSVVGYPLVDPGMTGIATTTLRNDGLAPVTFTDPPTVNLPYHKVLSTTCVGSLAAAKTCTVVTQFAPTKPEDSPAGTLTVPLNGTSVSVLLAGTVLPTSDVSVHIQNPTTAILPSTTNLWSVQVTNPTAGSATLKLRLTPSVSGGASITNPGSPVCTTESQRYYQADYTCEVVGDSVVLTVPPNFRAAVGRLVTYGNSGGTATMTATIIAMKGVTDPDWSNNSTQESLPVQSLPLADEGNTYAALSYGAAVVKADSSLSTVVHDTSTNPGTNYFATAIGSGVKAVFANGGLAPAPLAVLKSDGSVLISNNGSTAAGQLVPVAERIPNIVQIALDGSNTYFLTSDGSVWGMSDGGFPLYSNGTMGSAPQKGHIAPVKIFSGAIKIAVAGSTVFALKGDGTLWAMGPNNYGVMGAGNRTPSYSFTKVASNVISVSGGSTYVMLLRNDGIILYGGQVQLLRTGSDTVYAYGQHVPQGVFERATAISAGYTHATYIDQNGYLHVQGTDRAGLLINQGKLGLHDNLGPFDATYCYSLLYPKPSFCFLHVSNAFDDFKLTVLGKVISAKASSSNTIAQLADGRLVGAGMFAPYGYSPIFSGEVIPNITNAPYDSSFRYDFVKLRF